MRSILVLLLVHSCCLFVVLLNCFKICKEDCVILVHYVILYRWWFENCLVISLTVRSVYVQKFFSVELWGKVEVITGQDQVRCCLSVGLQSCLLACLKCFTCEWLNKCESFKFAFLSSFCLYGVHPLEGWMGRLRASK